MISEIYDGRLVGSRRENGSCGPAVFFLGSLSPRGEEVRRVQKPGKVVGCEGTEPGATGKETPQCISPNRKRGLKETWQASRRPSADFSGAASTSTGEGLTASNVKGWPSFLCVFSPTPLPKPGPVVCGYAVSIGVFRVGCFAARAKKRSRQARWSEAGQGCEAGRGLERRVAGSVKRKKRLPTCSRDPAIPCPVAQGMDEQQTTAMSSRRAVRWSRGRLEDVRGPFEGLEFRRFFASFFASTNFFPFFQAKGEGGR
ncbi:uncharacterized protein ARB_07187 [Trichophyton benhamiae CBS 112371]|uniref:Uncharacterized protein n=1 Tax=Arthroderma benhamiae (strain ATCC MYA-4681 / CBS 112371) TaxID=663331 RepID=D4ASH2_ARTBC|nr:uncharacterized protein ARB_07187 [Trichophyton benhamiae CBS 112371]EFE33722.1 hypothetical protein ARB_07187 [Trichophyton benhamiae CBS 112371]